VSGGHKPVMSVTAARIRLTRIAQLPRNRRQHAALSELYVTPTWPSISGIWHRLLTSITDAEQLKQWSNVFGLTTSKNTTNTPKSGWTQSIYGEGTATTAQLVGYSAQGVGHSVPQQEAMDLAFFGIS